MIVVRETFTAKPGCASKLAAQLKGAMEAVLPGRARVLTDLVGSFNTVVMEMTAASLSEFEADFSRVTNDPALRARMQGYTDLYQTGRREVYRVV